MIKGLPIINSDGITDVIMDVDGDEIQLLNGSWVKASLWEVDLSIVQELKDYFVSKGL